MTVKTRFFPSAPAFTYLFLFCQGIGAAHAAELTASMGGFRTLAEIETALDWLSENFPTVVSPKFSIGQSIEGRDLWAIRLSDNPAVYEPDEPTVWFDALHHAREPMSAEAVLRFAYTLAAQYGTDADTTRLIDSRNIILLPCVNPDGYEYNRRNYPSGGGLWRKNRRDNGDGSYGVDLNRNYSWQWGRDARLPASPIYQGSAPFSEPETAAIRDFLQQQIPTVYISVHTYGNEWVYPWGWSFQASEDDAVFRHYAAPIVAANGYILGSAWDLYGFSYGASDDYHYAEYGSLAYTVEIGSFDDGFWPAPSRIPALFEAVRPGFQRMAEIAGAWPVWQAPLWQEQQGNGDVWLAPGERWLVSFAVENQGTLPLNGHISAAGQQTPLSAAPREQGRSEPLLIELPDTPVYPLAVTLTYDGVNMGQTLMLPLSTPQIAKPGETLHLSVNGPANTPVTLFGSAQMGTAQHVPTLEGEVYLTGEIQALAQATTDAAGTATWTLPIPLGDALRGQSVYVQALFNHDGQLQVGRLLWVVLE